MIKVGLTGEMGSGKTYISKMFEKIGVPIFNSDDVAKKIINTNQELKAMICKEFGNVYDEDGMMIPVLIRSIVFANGAESKIAKLNEMVHPYVFDEFRSFCKIHSNEKYVITESAILYESGMDSVVDKVIYVQANEQTRIERAFKRSGVSEEEYRQRMKDQIPNKHEIADFIIINNTGSDIDSQVEHVHSCISK